MRRSLALGLAGLAAAACGSNSSSSGVAGGGGGDYCTLAKVVKDSASGLNQVFTSTDAASIKSSLKSLSQKFHAAASAAPSDISADWNTVAGAFDAVNNAVQGANDLNAMGSAVESVDSANSSLSSAADSAGTRIDTYTQQHCGFTINTSSGSSSNTSASSS